MKTTGEQKIRNLFLGNAQIAQASAEENTPPAPKPDLGPMTEQEIAEWYNDEITNVPGG